jgi:hypothetical protein
MSAQPRWDHTEPAPRPTMVRRPAREPERGPAMVLTAIAISSIAVGAIHIAAAATLGRDNAQNLAFFGVVAAAEIAWGVVALVRAPRWWLALGVLGNLAVVATWVVSRTVGLPVGPYAGVTLPVGFPDALATVLGAVIVIGAAALILRDRAPARAPARSLGATAATVVLVGALALVGAVSQANAFGSSSGSNPNGGGASVTNGYGGSSGGMTSGGGYSGGGY